MRHLYLNVVNRVPLFAYLESVDDGTQSDKIQVSFASVLGLFSSYNFQYVFLEMVASVDDGTQAISSRSRRVIVMFNLILFLEIKYNYFILHKITRKNKNKKMIVAILLKDSAT